MIQLSLPPPPQHEAYHPCFGNVSKLYCNVISFTVHLVRPKLKPMPDMSDIPVKRLKWDLSILGEFSLN